MKNCQSCSLHQNTDSPEVRECANVDDASRCSISSLHVTSDSFLPYISPINTGDLYRRVRIKTILFDRPITILIVWNFQRKIFSILTFLRIKIISLRKYTLEILHWGLNQNLYSYQTRFDCKIFCFDCCIKILTVGSQKSYEHWLISSSKLIFLSGYNLDFFLKVLRRNIRTCGTELEKKFDPGSDFCCWQDFNICY